MTNTGAEFKYTIPISKALSSPDGELYLEGIASGIEVDEHGDKMTPEAIVDFTHQIHKAIEDGSPIAFTEKHDEDNVFRDLGDIVDGYINDRFQLGIRVKLNPDNPASVLLFKDISKGKKHGMSIKGIAPDTAVTREFDSGLGRFVRTISKVILTSVGRTSSPSYTPSFGSVISKALSEHEAAEGDNSSMGETAPQAVEKSVEEETAPETIQEEVTEEIEKSTEIKFDKAKLDKLQKVIALADELGILSDVTPEVKETEVEKNAPSELDVVAETLSKVADTIGTLAETVVELDSKFSQQIEKTNEKLNSVLRETPEGIAPEFVEKAAPKTPEDALRILKDAKGKRNMSIGERMAAYQDIVRG